MTSEVAAPEVALPPGTTQAAIAALFPEPDPYLTDPVLWVRERLRLYMWSKQVEILESLKVNQYTAVKAAHSVSKSHTASCAIAWWLDVHKLGEAFAITTAPSWHQVNAILWRELKRRHREGQLAGRITMDCKWHMGIADAKRGDEDEELIAIGRKPADYDELTFQGIHARYFLAVLDEAGGVPEWLWNAVLTLATNEQARVLAIGNPDDPNSHFADICKPGSNWNVITISAWDSPNFTDEDVPEELKMDLLTKKWVADRERDWGKGSPLFVSKVDAEFPDVSDEFLFTPAILKQCYETDLSGLEPGRYGLDIARYGTDKSVIYRNRGGQIRIVKEWAKKDTMESAGEAAVVLRKHAKVPVPMNVDTIGLGAGVYDRLKEQGYQVGAYQGSERANNPAKFKNKRAESWWTFREMAEEGLLDLDPADDILAAHLQSVKWSTDSAGRIFIESKDDVRERGLPSPDRADAAVMSTQVVGEFIRREAQESITGDLLTKVM